MKIIGCLLVTILSLSLHAQDRILTIHGDEFVGKVMIVDTAFIHYIPKDTSVNTPANTKELQKINLAEVFTITYANGYKEVYTQNLPAEKPRTEVLNYSLTGQQNEYYLLGEKDAYEMFDATGAFVAGVFGFIPGAVVAGTPPKIKASRVSDPELIDNEEYRRGYLQAAGNKKVRNATAGFVCNVVVVVIGIFMSTQ